ncbi:MAG: ATP-binding protein [Bacteroidota bacterium]|nr:ATP-binding protein [Bacteroidota bacterium]MEC8597959.1 ATP-binding protein [Bacteroidota bacterium]
MNVLTPRGVAIASAMVITLLGMGLFALVLSLYGVQAPVQAYAALALALFALSMAVTYATIERFIYQKVRIIYKNIHRFKSTKERAKDLRMNEDVMEKVQQDVMDWAQERVQEISQLKEQENFRKEFIGNLAHELKTPVFNIQGYILTLLEGALEDPDHNRKFLIKAAKNVDRMAGLIDDLDVITKIEGGSLELELRQFNLTSLVVDVMDQLEQRAKRAGIEVEFVDENRRNVEVIGDAPKIEQVVTNLISNSLRYGKEGGKTEVRFYDMDEQMLVEVADDGIGMSEEHLPRIFERFYRVDKSRSRNAGGSGLGLSIVKHIIEAHGQTISVRSTQGKGSTFAFTLQKA